MAAPYALDFNPLSQAIQQGWQNQLAGRQQQMAEQRLANEQELQPLKVQSAQQNLTQGQQQIEAGSDEAVKRKAGLHASFINDRFIDTTSPVYESDPQKRAENWGKMLNGPLKDLSYLQHPELKDVVTNPDLGPRVLLSIATGYTAKPNDVLKLGEGENAYRPVRGPDGSIKYVPVAAGGQKTPSGFEVDPNRPGGLRPTAGGPADKITADQAARVALMTNAVRDMPKIREIYLGDEAYRGNPEKGIAPDTKGGVAPKMGSGFNPGTYADYYGSMGDVGQAQRLMASGMEGILRTLTGAAATKDEVQRELAQYLPAPTDNTLTRARKLDLFERNLKSIIEMSAHGTSGTQILENLRSSAIGKQTERLPTPTGTPAQAAQRAPLPPDQHAAAIAEANAAIKAGKDPAAVKKRLQELGVEFEENR